MRRSSPGATTASADPAATCASAVYAAGSASRGRTRDPAKPTWAPGSARTTSAPAPRVAQPPPVVGSRTTAICGSPAARVSADCRATRWSWVSASIPSCIRLPPVATSGTTGSWWARACAYAASSRSPVARPSEPPRKPNSKASSTAGVPSTRPVPQTTDSDSPVRSAARARAAS
ncbi:hypothetical protein SFUMM280S_04832 [Streptomyces fumanus]